MGADGSYHLLLTRPGWEAVASQYLHRKYGADCIFPLKPDVEGDEPRALISGYIFAQFKCCEANPCGTAPPQEELARCQDATPRYLMVFVREVKPSEVPFYLNSLRQQPLPACAVLDDKFKSVEPIEKSKPQAIVVYAPHTMPAETVLRLQDELTRNIRASSEAVINSLIGSMFKVPYGPLMGVKARIKRIVENRRDFNASICQGFVVDGGIFSGLKVSFPFSDIIRG